MKVTDKPEFKRWFSGSKVVDEKGEPLVVHHGTPDASFRVFKPGTHFTPDKAYASNYMKTTASSIAQAGKGKEAKNPAVFSVYLSIKRPFDTRVPSIRKVFDREYFGKYGNQTPLTEKGLPDWTDSFDIIDWIEETGQPYDGVIVDEGGTPESGWRGISWVPIRASQIKSATDDAGKFDPESDDIHESKVEKDGWVGPLYHGSTKKGLDRLDPGKFGTGPMPHGARGPVTWLTTSKNNAKFFTGRESDPDVDSYVYAAYVKMKNPMVVDASDEINGSPILWLDDAKQEGHDGLIVKNTHDGPEECDVYAVWSADQIKLVGSIHESVVAEAKYTLYRGQRHPILQTRLSSLSFTDDDGVAKVYAGTPTRKGPFGTIVDLKHEKGATLGKYEVEMKKPLVIKSEEVNFANLILNTLDYGKSNGITNDEIRKIIWYMIKANRDFHVEFSWLEDVPWVKDAGKSTNFMDRYTLDLEGIYNAMKDEVVDDMSDAWGNIAEVDVFILADSKVFVSVLKRLGYDGIIYRDPLAIKDHLKEKIAGKEVDDNHATYRPFDISQVKEVELKSLNEGKADSATGTPPTWIKSHQMSPVNVDDYGDVFKNSAAYDEVKNRDGYDWYLLKDVPITRLLPGDVKSWSRSSWSKLDISRDYVRENEARYDVIMKAIKAGGSRWPIILSASGRMVVDGFHRMAVISDLGSKTVDVLWPVRKKENKNLTEGRVDAATTIVVRKVAAVLKDKLRTLSSRSRHFSVDVLRAEGIPVEDVRFSFEYDPDSNLAPRPTDDVEAVYNSFNDSILIIFHARPDSKISDVLNAVREVVAHEFDHALDERPGLGKDRADMNSHLAYMMADDEVEAQVTGTYKAAKSQRASFEAMIRANIDAAARKDVEEENVRPAEVNQMKKKVFDALMASAEKRFPVLAKRKLVRLVPARA